MKWCVNAHKPRTLNDLKEATRQEIRPIDRQLLARVMDDLKKKGLKTASKKTVVILPISFLKLNSNLRAAGYAALLLTADHQQPRHYTPYAAITQV